MIVFSLSYRTLKWIIDECWVLWIMNNIIVHCPLSKIKSLSLIDNNQGLYYNYWCLNVIQTNTILSHSIVHRARRVKMEILQGITSLAIVTSSLCLYIALLQSLMNFRLNMSHWFIPWWLLNDSLIGTCHSLYMCSLAIYANINRKALKVIDHFSLYFFRSTCFKYSTVLFTASRSVTSS